MRRRSTNYLLSAVFAALAGSFNPAVALMHGFAHNDVAPRELAAVQNLARTATVAEELADHVPVLHDSEPIHRIAGCLPFAVSAYVAAIAVIAPSAPPGLAAQATQSVMR